MSFSENMSESYHVDDATSMSACWATISGSGHNWTPYSDGKMVLYTTGTCVLGRTNWPLAPLASPVARKEYETTACFNATVVLPNTGWSAVDFGILSPVYSSARAMFGMRIECSSGTYYCTSFEGYINGGYTLASYGSSAMYAYTTFNNISYNYQIGVHAIHAWLGTSSVYGSKVFGVLENSAISSHIAKMSNAYRIITQGYFPYLAVWGSGAKYVTMWKVSCS